MRLFHFFLFSVAAVAGASAMSSASAQGVGAQAPANETIVIALAPASQPAEPTADASRAVVKALPEYPVKALMAGVHDGQSLIEYTIDKDGSVGAVEVVNGTPYFGFNHNARRAVEQWRFRPVQEPMQRRVQFVFVAIP